MAAIIVFALTALQLIVIVASYILEAHGIFIAAVIHGSPLYALMDLLSADSVFLDSHPLFLCLFAYHIIKYFFFFRAQMTDQHGPLLTIAIIFEAIYLIISGYYIN